MKHCLTIAGSDSCGGAGIQGDIKTFCSLKTYGMSVVTAITAQNTKGVLDVYDIPPSIVKNQITAILDDISVDGIKIGMVSTTETIDTIYDALSKYTLPPIVLDPVMVSTSGYDLLDPKAKKTLVEKLFPISTLITPNLLEAESILKVKIKNIEDMKKSAKELYTLGPKNVLIKGGHLSDDPIDVLYDGVDFFILKEKRINAIHTHGTGCTLSSAITANLSKGMNIKESIEKSKQYITNAIKHGFSIGSGIGPVHHFYDLYKK